MKFEILIIIFLASICFIGQPFGSLISAVLTDQIGRRKTMLFVTLPNLTAWIALAHAKSLPIIFVSFALFGIGAGLMEAPIMTYLSEIW